jgi:hypothetical protein
LAIINLVIFIYDLCGDSCDLTDRKSYKTFYLCGVRMTGKITVLFQIVVLYCFIVSLCNIGIPSLGTSFRTDRSTKEVGYSQITGIDLIIQTTKTENVVNVLHKLPSFSLKNQINNFLAYRKATELFLLNTSLKYIFYARNIADRFPPTDIIFPFHYFW